MFWLRNMSGFSYNGTNGAGFLEALQPRIAATQSPGKWRQLDTVRRSSSPPLSILTNCPLRVISRVLTYFPASTCEYIPAHIKVRNANRQWSFFKAPDYDPAVTKYADENKQPFAINEAISATVVNTQARTFTGVAMVRNVPTPPLSSSPF